MEVCSRQMCWRCIEPLISRPYEIDEPPNYKPVWLDGPPFSYCPTRLCFCHDVWYTGTLCMIIDHAFRTLFISPNEENTDTCCNKYSNNPFSIFFLCLGSLPPRQNLLPCRPDSLHQPPIVTSTDMPPAILSPGSQSTSSTGVCKDSLP